MQEILRKCKFKANGLVIQAPPAHQEGWRQAGFQSEWSADASANTLVYVENRADLIRFLREDLKRIVVDSVLWIAYPKGTSSVKTDINRDSLRLCCETYRMSTVTAISIDATWSALRLRPTDCVGK